MISYDIIWYHFEATQSSQSFWIDRIPESPGWAWPWHDSRTDEESDSVSSVPMSSRMNNGFRWARWQVHALAPEDVEIGIELSGSVVISRPTWGRLTLHDPPYFVVSLCLVGLEASCLIHSYSWCDKGVANMMIMNYKCAFAIVWK